MIDGVSLDQLRVFIAAADEKSFSAAGRKLARTQSVVSHAIANLEARLGVVLFDRGRRYPVLTPAGVSLLARAREVIRGVEALKAQARSLAGGLEAELALAVDVMFPQDLLTRVVRDFAAQFPSTPLRLFVEALGGVAEAVIRGRCAIGVVGELPNLPPTLQAEWVRRIPLVTVVAPASPLALLGRPATREEVAAHTQLVVTDRSPLTQGVDFGVLSPRTWRLADLGAKHAFLLAGLGWGHMPAATVADDLAAGRLVAIEVEGALRESSTLPMQAVYRAEAHPGPAGRWFIEQIREPLAP
ncbi:MAG: LysR family transcriptional regulator [Phenylobacterium sp.]|uniref:LysR family transcriptional regulator n=1 Tax=Phenylobacterium sp. TaxID=1871053 RepID=UPI00185EE604|nr:LysR family transcriptional regulator [Phenylobacterium sp.]MBA4795186.1 LysR family transcriptional regulator [Phenylobacterium sp.]